MAFSNSKEWTFGSGMNGLFRSRRNELLAVERMAFSKSKNELQAVEWMVFSKSKNELQAVEWMAFIVIEGMNFWQLNE